MPKGEAKVFLGNLPPDCKVRDIENFFEKHGKVRNVLIKQGKYGFAEFEDVSKAKDAVYELHGKKLNGNRINLELAKGPRKGERRAPWVSKYGAPVRTKHALIVQNLSTRVSWQDLKDLFRKAGEVCFAEAHVEERNLARVEFLTRQDLERVVTKYQGYRINGRDIKLVEIVQRSRSRSESQEQHRSCSRSKSRSANREEVDPDDQDVKRQRKRSYSKESKRSYSKESRHSKRTHSHSSRSHSRQSENHSPSRKSSRRESRDGDDQYN